jgi:hypothetical protein
MFIHEDINAKLVLKHTTKRFSTLWINVTEHGHSIIYACIYHPKSRSASDSEEILHHLSDSIVKLSTKYTNSFVIGGDFNHLNIDDITTIFHLQNIIPFPTRQDAHLDRIYTNVKELFSITPAKLAPLYKASFYHQLPLIAGYDKKKLFTARH